jgi:hypothetical protein
MTQKKKLLFFGDIYFYEKSIILGTIHIRKIQYTTIKIPFSRLEPRAYKKENLSLLFQEKCHFYENSIIFGTIHIKKIRFSTAKVLFFRDNPRVQKTKIFFL